MRHPANWKEAERCQWFFWPNERHFALFAWQISPNETEIINSARRDFFRPSLTVPHVSTKRFVFFISSDAMKKRRTPQKTTSKRWKAIFVSRETLSLSPTLSFNRRCYFFVRWRKKQPELALLPLFPNVISGGVFSFFLLLLAHHVWILRRKNEENECNVFPEREFFFKSDQSIIL